MNGVVKWFNRDRGYGFISPLDGGQDVFVHYSDIATEGFRTLDQGATVEFELKPSEKGPRAANVRPKNEHP